MVIKGALLKKGGAIVDKHMGHAVQEVMGYEELSGVDYRVLDIFLPLLVDDSASLMA